jgi:hypothetical protein
MRTRGSDDDGSGSAVDSPNADPAPDDLPVDDLDDEVIDTKEIPESDDEEGGEPAAPPQQVEPPTRGRARGQPYGQRIRDLETRNSELDRTIRDLLARQNAPRQPTQAEIAEQQRLERERFEQMTPYEQHLYSQQQLGQAVQRAIGQAVQPLRDQSDRMEYDGLLRENPAYRRFDAQVEDLKRQAPDVPRRLLLATAIGMRAMEQGGAAATRQRNQAAANAGRQGTRPSQSRGDVPSERGRQGQTAADRLRGVKI